MKFSKKADLKEYSNEATKGINDFIVQHPKVMEVVIDAAKRATDEKSFTDWLQEALTGEGMEEGVRKEVKWEELGWAWFNTVNRETTEPTSTDIIEKLPTLDKPKKIDELLEQLSIEQDPAKKEQIKQHIERIKRAKLLVKADELGEPVSPLQPAEDRGSKQISKYDPEYSFLVRLVKLLAKEIPESIPEIKALASSQPFFTVDDVGNLTAKIWTLATTKYQIPREWLISKLPEKKVKGNLDKKANSEKYWIYPDGDYEAIEEDAEHTNWLQEVEGLDPFQAFDRGWIRASVGNNLGSYQLKDFNNIPKYLDDFIISHPSKEIEIADRNGYNYIQISYEDAISKGIQKAVKRSLINTSKKADLWPSQQETSEGTCTQAPGQIATNPLQEKDTSVSGPNPQDVANEDALWDIVVNEFLTAHKRWSEVVKAIRLAHPEVTDSVILSLKDRVRKSLDNQMGMIGSKKVAYHAINDLTQFVLDDKQIQQHFKNRGTTVEDVIASLPNFTIKYITKELEQRDPSLRDHTKGFYDYNSGTLYINPRLSLDSKRLTIIHEIEHAIQDAQGVLPVHTEEDLSQVEKTPYQDRSFEWGARQQQFNALKARGLSSEEVIKILLARAGANSNEPWIEENVRNEAEQMEDIYNEMMPESIMASKKISKRHLNMDQVIKILDSKDNKVDHIDFTTNEVELLSGERLSFDEATQRAVEMDKTAEGEFTGAEFSTDAVGVNPSMDSGPWSSPEDQSAKPQKLVWPNTEWLPADDENKDEQPYSNIASNLNRPFSKKAYSVNILSWVMNDPEINKYFKDRGLNIKDIKKYLPYLSIRYWNDSSPVQGNDKETTVAELRQQGVKLENNTNAYYYPPTGEIFLNPTRSLQESRDTLEHEIEHALQDSEGILPPSEDWQHIPYNIRTHEWGAQLPVIRDLKSKGYSLEQVLQYVTDKYNKHNPSIVPVKVEDMNDEARNKIEQLYELASEVEPQSVVSKQAFCKKEANPPTRYWIAPDGTEFDAGTNHGAWITHNKDILKKYGVNISTVGYAWDSLLNKGWVRVSNEPAGTGFQIQVKDLNHLPSFLDDFIARNYYKGNVIEVGDQSGNLARVYDPFPSIQKAVNKALRNPVNASLKQAAVSGEIVNDILEVIESSGGITYNMSQGNLHGANLYSVSLFPERELILNGVAEHDDIQHYLDANEDLLSDPNNSFGVWVNKGQTYLDVVVTIPDKKQALELAREHNQLAIYDLAKGQEVPTGIQRNVAFSKKDIIKKAEESVLPEEQQNQVAAKWCPAMNIALANYASAVKNGHDPIRAFDYALQSVSNIDSSIKESDLREAINTYLGPVK